MMAGETKGSNRFGCNITKYDIQKTAQKYTAQAQIVHIIPYTSFTVYALIFAGIYFCKFREVVGFVKIYPHEYTSNYTKYI